MNVHQILEKLIRSQSGRYDAGISIRYCSSLIDQLAPKIEAALRETAESMENYYLSCGVSPDRKRSTTAMEKCIAAGVEKLADGT